MRIEPGILARRAVHQYRRRDILAYASLRLYLRSHCALQDRWVHEIAVDQIIERGQPCYNCIRQFKQIAQNGHNEFRDLHIPGPNEILAETALLSVCADAPDGFQSPPSVFSYELSSGREPRAVFRYYFPRFRARHQAIAAACRREPDAVVIYADIRKFYPSVTIDLAKTVWRQACEAGGLSDRHANLGAKLLSDHAEVSGNTGAGLLTGPMFSHLIGDLVLRRVDEEMEKVAPGQYFRYVDDVAIVAPKEKARDLEKRMAEMLADCGLSLHDGKRLEVSAARWLDAEHDFDGDQGAVSWMTFVGGLKQLMLFYPDTRAEMTRAFRDAGIRILPLDYSEVEQERGYLERMQSLLGCWWFRRLTRRRLTPERIIDEGLVLRDRYMMKLEKTLGLMGNADTFDRKRYLHRLRFLVPRLGYLADPDNLRAIADSISSLKEMAMASAVFEAIAASDVTSLLKFGPSAAQAVAQPLRVNAGAVRCSATDLNSEEAVQAYAILQLNRVRVEMTAKPPRSPMVTFCQGGTGVGQLFDSKNVYFRELGCLHGKHESDALRWAIETAFDRDENMAFDMQEIAQGSS